MIPEEYKLTDKEITEAVYSHQKKNSPSWPKSLYPRDRLVADAATAKARKVTLEEVRGILNEKVSELRHYADKANIEISQVMLLDKAEYIEKELLKAIKGLEGEGE